MMNQTSKLAEITARAKDCLTYRFGLRAADKLAHDDVPYLLHLVQAQAAKLEAASVIIEDLITTDPCSFDHHGGCQAHGYISLQPGETCPQHDAKEWTRTNTQENGK